MTLVSLVTQNQPPCELKGSLFTLTVVHLYQTNQEAIDRYLSEKVKQAPSFFNNAPVVIDLEALAERETAIDFTGLHGLLRKHGMVPVGVRNGNPELQTAAVLAGLPVLPEGRSVAKKPDKTEKSEAPAVKRQNKIHTQPVRSGQQVYAPEGDLILLGSISPGAEILADGNIHVYGPLRGRALAGVKGDTQARIFCQSLEAELISIAGQYRVIEQLDADLRHKYVQIYLSGNRLVIEPLR